MILDVIAKVLALVFLVLACLCFGRAALRIMPDSNEKESCAKRDAEEAGWLLAAVALVFALAAVADGIYLVHRLDQHTKPAPSGEVSR